MKSKTEIKFKNYFKAMTEALEFYREDHNIQGANDQETAIHIIDFCNSTFEYIAASNMRIEHFLQGLGISIPYLYVDIWAMAIKDKRLKKSDDEDTYLKVSERYFKDMRMILNIISNKVE